MVLAKPSGSLIQDNPANAGPIDDAVVPDVALASKLCGFPDAFKFGKFKVFSSNGVNWNTSEEDMKVDRSLKEISASGKHAMNREGDGSKERKVVLSHMLGVRDGSGRNATKAEMLDVSKHLYFYLVKNYLEGLKSGKWDTWDEETDFPRHEFQDHSSRDDDGVFDGYDFNVYVTEKLLNGLDGVKAAEVIGASKTKVMTWKSHLCGGGLESSIKEAIDDHADAQGAMNASARKNKKGASGMKSPSFFNRNTCSGAIVLTGSIFSGPVRSNRR